jgi:hypothetical protein
MECDGHQDKASLSSGRRLGPGERIELVEIADGIRFVKLKADLPIADAGPYSISLDEIGAEHFRDAASRLGCTPREIVFAHRAWVLSIKHTRLNELIPKRQSFGVEKVCGNCSKRRRGYCRSKIWDGTRFEDVRESVDEDEPACMKFVPSSDRRSEREFLRKVEAL